MRTQHEAVSALERQVLAQIKRDVVPALGRTCPLSIGFLRSLVCADGQVMATDEQVGHAVLGLIFDQRLRVCRRRLGPEGAWFEFEVLEAAASAAPVQLEGELA